MAFHFEASVIYLLVLLLVLVQILSGNQETRTVMYYTVNIT